MTMTMGIPAPGIMRVTCIYLKPVVSGGMASNA